MRGVACLLLLVPLAGCASEAPEPAAPPALHILLADALEPGGAYAFTTPGGRFVATAPEGARVAVYGPDDALVALLRLNATRPSAGFVLLPGESVVAVVELNGSLEIGGDSALRFRPLGAHLERVQLVDREPSTLPAPGSRPIDERVPVAFQRAPIGLSVLAGGDYRGLAVTVSSPRGVALEVVDAGGPFLRFPLVPPTLDWVPAASFHENFAAGAYDVRVQANHLDGVLLLESVSYSRAMPKAPPAANVEPAYEYGEVAGRPVAFEVHPSATGLLVRNGGEHPAVVAIFDPEDRRIGTVAVAPGQELGVPVSGGTHVAVALAGSATLWADRAPADLDTLHHLERRFVQVPERTPGANGRYEAVEGRVVVEGTIYAAESAWASFDPLRPTLFSCGSGPTVRLVQEDTVGVATLPPGSGTAALYLGDGQLRFIADGVESGCSGPAFEVHAYVRP